MRFRELDQRRSVFANESAQQDRSTRYRAVAHDKLNDPKLSDRFLRRVGNAHPWGPACGSALVGVLDDIGRELDRHSGDALELLVDHALDGLELILHLAA